MKLTSLLNPAINLEESRTDFVLKMEPRLRHAWEKDLQHKYDKDEPLETLVSKLQETDPTKNKEYIVFIARMYAAGEFKLEDTPRLLKDLTLFNKVKRKLQNKDIMSYKNLESLYAALEPFEASDDQLLSNKELIKKAKSGAKYLIDTPNFKALIPLTQEAAQLYGAGTKWCTSAAENCMFDEYHSSGNLIIIIAKKAGKDVKYQFHVETQSFMNAQDQPLKPADISFLSEFPEYRDLLNVLIKQHYLA